MAEAKQEAPGGGPGPNRGMCMYRAVADRGSRSVRRLTLRVIIVLVAAVGLPAGLAAAASAGPAARIKRTDWPAYLDGPAHHSYAAAERAITPKNARRLTVKWRFKPRPSHRGQPFGFLSSPTVADGAIFVGSSNGWFYKLNENTGAVEHRIFIGYQRHRTCPAQGFVDTATVAPDPRTRHLMVYVGGPTGILYALRASNLSTKWRADIARPSRVVNDYFEWSSPTVSGGRIFIGVGSNCDRPLIRGQVVSYSQETGRVIARFFTEPPGVRGATVWGSAAVNGKYVYVGTGNPMGGRHPTGYAVSILKLSVNGLRLAGTFQVPFSQITNDGDFGSSPALFWPYVGACNKNGIFYVLNQVTMALRWSRRIGASSSQIAECSAAAVYNGRFLYIAGPATTIRGHRYRGSIREIGPRTGRVVWATGLSNGVIGTPTMDRAGLIAVGTYGANSAKNAIYLINGHNGKIIRTLQRGGLYFAQSVFANGLLITAGSAWLEAWQLP
jgi:outer membrane protein assembly factor BamB